MANEIRTLKSQSEEVLEAGKNQIMNLETEVFEFLGIYCQTKQNDMEHELSLHISRLEREKDEERESVQQELMMLATALPWQSWLETQLSKH